MKTAEHTNTVSEATKNAASKALFFQAKLSINVPGDVYEQEADAVADEVMRMSGVPSPKTFFTPSAVRLKASSFEKKAQLKASQAPDSSESLINCAPASTSIENNGHSTFEPKIGDLINSRLHSDSLGEQSADKLNAVASTDGNDIAFKANHYHARTESGKSPIGNVVQQSNNNRQVIQTQRVPDEIDEEEGIERDRFRQERRRDLERIIECSRFNKIRRDCPSSTGVRLLNVLAAMRTRVAGNAPCLSFFSENFHINPDIMFRPAERPSITFVPLLGVSGRTRCPEPSCSSPIPSVSVGTASASDNICNSPLLERVIMHELTHYAQCYVRPGQISSEELAIRGADVCMGTVQEANDAARARSQRVQPKLVSADPGNQIQKQSGAVTPNIVQLKCAHCESEERQLHRKEDSAGTEVAPSTENYIHSLSGGAPLDHQARSFFESGMGYDFSDVRIHTDSSADQSAKNLNALAYTHGRDIVFKANQYQPQTENGKRLLAHELTHVIQQNNEQVSKKVQRTINYIRQLDSPESQPYLDAFDRSLQTLEANVVTPQVPLPQEVQQAIQLLRRFRTEGRITCWETSGGLVYASYDNATQQIRLHINFTNATTTTTILHEAIHALHAAGNPEIARVYGQVLAQGGTTDQNLGILLSKWKAWTEYWAYRGTSEYNNSIQTDPAFRQDAHRTAMSQPDVRSSVQRVRELTGQDFDPATWSPPAHWVAPAAYRQRRR